MRRERRILTFARLTANGSEGCVLAVDKWILVVGDGVDHEVGAGDGRRGQWVGDSGEIVEQIVAEQAIVGLTGLSWQALSSLTRLFKTHSIVSNVYQVRKREREMENYIANTASRAFGRSEGRIARAIGGSSSAC